jgi:hypothetical protein
MQYWTLQEAEDKVQIVVLLYSWRGSTEILKKQSPSILKFFCALSDTHLNFWNGSIIFLPNNGIILQDDTVS